MIYYSFFRRKKSFKTQHTESRQKLRAVDLELEQERLRVRDSKSLNTRILAELHEAVGLIQDPPKLKETVRAMYEKFGRFEGEFVTLVIESLKPLVQVLQFKTWYKNWMPKLSLFVSVSISSAISPQFAPSWRRIVKSIVTRICAFCKTIHSCCKRSTIYDESWKPREHMPIRLKLSLVYASDESHLKGNRDFNTFL